MSSSLSKKIITYDAVERYHDNLEEQLNNEYLRKDELVQSDWACDDHVSNEYIKNRTHYSIVCNNLAELNIQDGWNTGDVLCSVPVYYFEDEHYSNKDFVQITNNTGNFKDNTLVSIPKDGATIDLPLNGPSMSATWRRVVNDPADPLSDMYELVFENNYNIYIDNALSIDLMEAQKQLSEPYIPASIARVDDVNDMLPIEKGAGENSIVQKGSNNIASGKFSVALGKDSNAEGNYSFASGNSVASGEYSHAEGKGTQAKGRASHTEGWYTITNNESEHASGKFNVSTKSSDKSQATQFSIGIGTSDTNRKNAFEVKQNGDIYVDGVEGRIQDRLNIDLLVPIEHSDLKKLRDSNQLIPGQKYRIIDYITTTTQENTSSALHPFDVIVTALDNRTLSENASAIRSDRDYDGYFETENVEAWQLKYCLDNDIERFAWADNSAVQWYSRIVANYIVDQSETHTYTLDKESYIYDYGSEPHPDTGEDTLVFYTGDPMYFKESGADHQDIYFYNGITTVNGVEYDSWRKYSDNQWVNAEAPDEGVYALTKRIVYNGEFVWPDNTGIENGKGVIYNMIDEYGNECPYDFKNIKFYHDGLGTDVYTFTWIDENYEVMDTSVFGNNGTLTSRIFLDTIIYGVYGNVIKPYMKMIYTIYDENTYEYLGTKQSLNNITFISDYGYVNIGNAGFHGCYNNSFGNGCYNNSFGNNCYNNAFGNNCDGNCFGDSCHNNSFGNNCNNNYFGNRCNNNSFVNYCYNNSFGNNCYNNSFGNNCYNNSFGDSCDGNCFGDSCYDNSFGNRCNNNSFGNNCYNNAFGNNCYNNSFGDSCDGNCFGDSCYDNSFVNYCDGNSFGNVCGSNSFGNYCGDNSFGNECGDNSFGTHCDGNSFGNECTHNSFRISANEDDTLLDYCYYNHFDDGCSYNVIWNSIQPTLSNKLQNINVIRGVSGKSYAYNFINIADTNAGYEIKVAKNSSGAIKIYCEADLIK